MGYHLTILRTQGAKQLPISEVEFTEACQSQVGLDIADDPSVARFTCCGELVATLKLQDGEVWTNVAEPEVIGLMLELAEKLGARVRGDEGETYRSIDDVFTHPDDESGAVATESNVDHIRRKRAFWNIIRFLALLAAIGLIIANKLRE
jgi:hypothetical protein